MYLKLNELLGCLDLLKFSVREFDLKRKKNKVILYLKDNGANLEVKDLKNYILNLERIVIENEEYELKLLNFDEKKEGK